MKKIAILSLFSLISLLGTAQVNVGNSTAAPIIVGVQFTAGGCMPVASINATILPGESFLFNPPMAGLEVLRVGVIGDAGEDSEFNPCGACAGGVAAAYEFDWTPDCSHLKIKP